MDFLVDHVEIAAAAWAVLLTSDLLLTLAGARLLKAGADRYFKSEGSYELNPIHQKQIDQLKTFSPRFILGLVFSSGLLIFLGHYNRDPEHVPHAVEFVLGGMYLIEAAIHKRHFSNLYMFRRVLRSEGAAGAWRISRNLAYGVSAVDLSTFAVLFLALFGLTGRAFFLGGAATCLVSAIRDMLLARKHRATVGPPA